MDGKRELADVRRVFVYGGPHLGAEARAVLGDGRGWVIVNLSADCFLSDLFPAAVFRHPNTYVPASDKHAIQDEARMLARCWHEALPQHVREYRGIDLTSASEQDATGEFVRVLTALRVAEAVTSDGPDVIAMIDDGGSLARALRLVADARDIRVTAFPNRERARVPVGMASTNLWKLVVARAARAMIDAVSRPRRRSAILRLVVPAYFRFEPLLEDLAKDSRVQIDVLGSGRSALQDVKDRRSGIRHPLMSGYLSLHQWAALVQHRRALRRLPLDEVIAAGPSVRQYRVLDVCRSWLELQLQQVLPSYAAFLEMADSLLARERITHVMVNQDVDGQQRILCLAANRRGVRTICCQHGITVTHEFPKHVSETYAAWGDGERDTYERLGRDTDFIHVLGDPFLAYVRNQQFDRGRICSKLGLDPGRPVALMTCERYVAFLAPEEWPLTPNERLAQVCQAAASVPGVQLLIRFKNTAYDEHGDSAAVKHCIIDRFNTCGNIHVDPGGNLYERLFIADTVIVTISTVGLEAVLFGKRLFVLAEPNASEAAEYVSSGVATRISGIMEIQRALESVGAPLPASPSAREACRQYIERNFANVYDRDPLCRLRDFLLDAH